MYNPATDARRLNDAMRGIGTNDTVLIDILAHRDYMQRQMLATEYKSAFGKDIVDDLHSETSGHYRSIVTKLMMPRDEMFAELLHEAMEGAGTNDGVLIDIMTQFPYELPAIAATFQRKFGKSLESVIKSETTGNYEDALCTLLNTPRPPPGVIDSTRAATAAETFYKAGEGRLGTNERTYMTLLASNSFQQIALIDSNYRNRYKKSMEDAIKSETSGHLCDTLVACVTPFDKYFAKRIYEACKGAGTNDLSLVEIFVANDRTRLQSIANAFKTLYGMELSKRIAEEVSGHYKRILEALL